MSYKSILIIKMSAIGDVIHALPVASALKARYPEAHITWIVEKPAYELLTNNPDVDDIVLFDKPGFKSLRGIIANGPKLSRSLKACNFDLALDLQGLFKSAAVSLLSGAKLRLGYCNMREGSGLVSRPVCGPNQTGHVVDRYLDVVRSIGAYVDEPVFPVIITENEAQAAIDTASHAGLEFNKPYVVLAPGTNWPTKRWPTASYAQLADKLARETEYQVVITGGSGDAGLASQIVSRSSTGVVDLTGKTGLKQLAHILKNAKAFIGSDSGPMHLAVALGTPVVAMFGPSDPDRNGPYRGNNVVITVDRKCVRCQKKRCEQECLQDIAVDSVFEKTAQLLKTT